MNISEEAKTFLGLMEKNIVHKIGTEVLDKNHVDKEKESFQTVYERCRTAQFIIYEWTPAENTQWRDGYKFWCSL